MSLLLLFSVGRSQTVGGPISGGQFSRGRWRKLQDELEAKRLAAVAERERQQRLKREAKEAKRLADAEARRLAREEAAALADALLQGLIAAHAQQAQQAALGLVGHVQDASKMAEYAKAAQAQQEAEDEEAVMLLASL